MQKSAAQRCDPAVPEPGPGSGREPGQEAEPGGFIVQTMDVVGSTNDAVRALAITGAAGRIAVRADEQTAGRGRRGRNWSSPPGNLYFSVLLRPDCPAGRVAELSFVLAVAAGDTVAALTAEERVHHKWPNDILLDECKLSGIMLESSLADDGAVDWVIAGCGMNLVSHPTDSAFPATNLGDAGALPPPPEEMLGIFLERLGSLFDRWQEDGFASVREAWLARAWRIGRDLTIRLPDREIHGVFETLDSVGTLILATPDGGIEAVSVGDVFAAGN